jgi:hypothetical protein
MSEVSMKTMRHGRDTLVAVCDIELLGKTLKGGDYPFVVSVRFYGGNPATLEEAIEAMEKATICNIVGKKIVKAAIDAILVQEAAVIYYGDIPHAQTVHM